MHIKTLSAALSLFLLCRCSSSDKNEDTMISLADYNSYYSEVLNSSGNETPTLVFRILKMGQKSAVRI